MILETAASCKDENISESLEDVKRRIFNYITSDDYAEEAYYYG